MVALLAGGTLMGILGAILSLPVAATVVMLLEDLRVELPGAQPQSTDTLQNEADDRGEEEYLRRAAGLDVAGSAAIAAEISMERRAEDERVLNATESPQPDEDKKQCCDGTAC